MRLSVSDETGALEKITTAFKAANINISNIIQKERYDGRAQVVILTDMVNEASFNLKQTMLDTDVVLLLMPWFVLVFSVNSSGCWSWESW